MKHYIAIRIRKQSWGIAVLFVIAFCWLGFSAESFGALFNGVQANLPLATKFAIAYGPIAFPLFGVAAALAFILSDALVRSRWVQWAMAAMFGLLLVWAVKGLLVGGSFLGPVISG